MPRPKYKSVNLPENLYRIVKEAAEKYGYSGVDDFVREAVREKLKRMGLIP